MEYLWRYHNTLGSILSPSSFTFAHLNTQQTNVSQADNISQSNLHYLAVLAALELMLPTVLLHQAEHSLSLVASN